MDNLEEKLIQDKWVSLEQLNLANQESRRIGKSLWVCLVRLGILTQEDVSVFFAQESGIPYVRISDYQISEEVIKLVDEEFCRENLILPLFKIKDILFVAFVNPLDTTTVDSLLTQTGCQIEPLIANMQSIRQAQDDYYGLQEKIFDFRRLIMKEKPARSLPFYRNSERVPLNLPVLVSIEDKSLALRYSSALEGVTRDITRDGMAVGIYVFLFIPKGATVNLEFKPGEEKAFSKESIKVRGEVVYCRMQRGLRYFLGIRFIKADEKSCHELLKFIK
ncbi:MAG: PilZ domain-containing protein [Candidatus Omnitrophica bacterium]|nr:PilZ domain-containing protein [Candidatus Omnitrophota bacterium]MBU1872094.1 PilZ domain-containing protein [Candidatus Omnitrophota bacterium]